MQLVNFNFPHSRTKRPELRRDCDKASSFGNRVLRFAEPRDLN